jgi:hypothetical protein
MLYTTKPQRGLYREDQFPTSTNPSPPTLHSAHDSRLVCISEEKKALRALRSVDPTIQFHRGTLKKQIKVSRE